MACDSSLLEGVLDDWEDEEEDWTSTDWAEPTSSKANQHDNPVSKTHSQCPLSVSESMSCMKTDQSKSEQNSEVVQRMLLNDNKAGMEGLDKERINQIIHEASKGSKFYENERQKEEQMKRRIDEQKQKIKQITPEQLKQGTLEADKLLEDFEQQRDLSRTIVHVDMDMFYAAVEMKDNPSLKNKPMAVGGNSMLSTSNYHARKFGVRAAMPGFIGKKLCPELVIVPLNFEKYSAVSRQVRAIMADYDPNFCPMSLDEAYLDLTEHLQNRKSMSVEERTFICRDSKYVDSRAHCKCDLNEIARNYWNETVLQDGPDLNEFFSKAQHVDDVSNSSASETANRCVVICPVCKKELPPFKHMTFGLSDEDAVNEMRTRIEQKTTLTASAGIAPNMMLAKVCSDKNKPNGQYKIKSTLEDVMKFIKDLPTRKISGIGKVSEAMLNAVGVYTCTDLYERRGLLYHLYSQISFNYFMRICLGIGSTTVERDSERKSMSTERTFSELSKPADLYQKCEELCESLAEDLKSERLKGKTVSIKIKTVKFEVRTRAHTVRDYTNDYEDIVRSAIELLRTEIQHSAPQPLKLRLMGVRMSNLLHESLCQGKKQNTIIGAFKLLAKLSPKKKHINETQGGSGTNNVGETDAELVKKPIVHGGMDKNSDKMPNYEMDKDSEKIKDEVDINSENIAGGDPKEPVIKADRVKCNHTPAWTTASDVLDDTAKDKSMRYHDTQEVIVGLNVPELAKSASLVDCNDCREAFPGTETSENSDSEASLEKIDKFVPEHKGAPMLQNVRVTEENDDVKEKDEIKATNDLNNVNKGVNDKVANLFSLSSSYVKEKETSMILEDIVSQDKVSIFQDGVTVPQDRVSSTQEKVCGTIDQVNSVFSPHLRTTRSGIKRTPVPQSKRKNKRNKTKGKAEDSAITYTCPVCALNILCESLQSFNEHVDMCLESGEQNKSIFSSSDKRVVSPESSTNIKVVTISDEITEGEKKNATVKTHESDITDSETSLTKEICSNEKLKENFKSAIQIARECITEDNTEAGSLECEKSKSKGDNSGMNNISCQLTEYDTDTYSAVIESTISNSFTVDENQTDLNKEEGKDKDLLVREDMEDSCKTDKNDENTQVAELARENSSGFDVEYSSKESIVSDTAENINTDNWSDKIEIKSESEMQHSVLLNVDMAPTKKSDMKSSDSCDRNVNGGRLQAEQDTGCKEMCESDVIQSVETSVNRKKDTIPEESKSQTGNCKEECQTEDKRIEFLSEKVKHLQQLENEEKSDSEIKEKNYSENCYEYKEVPLSLIPLSPKIIIKNGNDNLENGLSGQEYDQSKVSFLDSARTPESNETICMNTRREWLQTAKVRKNIMHISDEIEELQEDEVTDDVKGDGDMKTEGSLLVCPVCNLEQRSADLNEFNSHVDSCLSRGAISQILREQKQENGGVKRNREQTPLSTKSVKRRKTTMPGSSKSCRSIASFFIEK